MAAQQLAIHDAIIGLKRTLSRPRESTFAEDPISQPTNRGNKLKRRAEHVQQGHLDNPSGPATFKLKIEHAGYTRKIQYYNTPRYDVDGDLIERWGDEEGEGEDEEDRSVIEDENIYKGIKLEKLLGPLTSTAELPLHPSLSVPYKSRALSEMVKHAEDFLHQQQRLLWKMKQILVTLRGDSSWVPVGAVETAYDDWLLHAGMDEGPEIEGWTKRTCLSSTIPDQIARAQREKARDALTEEAAGEGREEEKTFEREPADGRKEKASCANSEIARQTDKAEDRETADATREAHDEPPSPRPNRSQDPSRPNGTAAGRPPPGLQDTEIHPLFDFNRSCIPGHDAFLPAKEADDARALFVQYVSKLEEIVRNASKLHEGLLRAKLMGETVWTWCRAEAHVGEMSDGEDWYDKEEWGLDEDLAKGEEEEEEVSISQKKPRRRGEK